MYRTVVPFVVVSALGVAGCERVAGLAAIAEAHAEPAAAALAPFSYEARLSPLDHVNSKGVVLSDVAAVLRQDRARVHAGRGDSDDQKDAVLGADGARDAFEKLARASKLDAALHEAIVSRNPKVKVEVLADRVAVTVLDKGSDEVACLLVDGHLNGVSWDAPVEQMSLAPRWQNRSWKTDKQRDAMLLRRPDGSAVATFERPADGPTGLKLEGPTCSTPYGVRIGATLADAKLDPLIKQAICNCQGSKNVILWASDNAFTFQYRIDASCKKPVQCKASDTDVMCPAAIGRSDCVITAIRVQQPAG